MSSNNFMPWFSYNRLHIPTGTITTGKQQFISRALFLAALAQWNASPSPDQSTWKYWEQS